MSSLLTCAKLSVCLLARKVVLKTIVGASKWYPEVNIGYNMPSLHAPFSAKNDSKAGVHQFQKYTVLPMYSLGKSNFFYVGGNTLWTVIVTQLFLCFQDVQVLCLDTLLTP